MSQESKSQEQPVVAKEIDFTGKGRFFSGQRKKDAKDKDVVGKCNSTCSGSCK